MFIKRLVHSPVGATDSFATDSFRYALLHTNPVVIFGWIEILQKIPLAN